MNREVRAYYEDELRIRENSFNAGAVAALYDAILLCLEKKFASPRLGPRWIRSSFGRGVFRRRFA